MIRSQALLGNLGFVQQSGLCLVSGGIRLEHESKPFDATVQS